MYVLDSMASELACARSEERCHHPPDCGVDKHSSGCDQNDAIGSAHDAADRSFLDGGTQWTPLSAAVDNRSVSSVVGAPNGRVGRTDAEMKVFTRVLSGCHVLQAITVFLI